MTDPDERDPERAGDRGEIASPGGDVTVDEMSDASFPASDAPARWTWEVQESGAIATTGISDSRSADAAAEGRCRPLFAAADLAAGPLDSVCEEERTGQEDREARERQND